MAFLTQEDYKNILRYIKDNGIKDSEFDDIGYPLKGDEYCTLVRNGKNYKAQVRNLFLSPEKTTLDYKGDQILTEADIIDSVKNLGDNTYRLNLKRKWDEYYTDQVVNNVLKGVSDSNTNNDYVSWMRINSVNKINNSIEVTLYPDSDTPSGKNNIPVKSMIIYRWGNQTNKDYQNCLFLSRTKGQLIRYINVTKPIIDKSNYGPTIGLVPDFIEELGLPLQDGTDYSYIPGIVTSSIIRIGPQGKPTSEVVDRGIWKEGEKYYHEDLNPETGVYEISDVWYMGCKYRCQKTGTKTAPTWNNTDWAMIEGNPAFKIEFAEVDSIYDPSTFKTTLTIVATLYNQDVTDSILTDDIVWTRYSEDKDGNERVESDRVWALKHINSGKSISLTTDDCDFNGYIPKVLKFIATVTLRDGMNNELNSVRLEFNYK